MKLEKNKRLLFNLVTISYYIHIYFYSNNTGFTGFFFDLFYCEFGEVY